VISRGKVEGNTGREIFIVYQFSFHDHRVIPRLRREKSASIGLRYRTKNWTKLHSPYVLRVASKTPVDHTVPSTLRFLRREDSILLRVPRDQQISVFLWCGAFVGLCICWTVYLLYCVFVVLCICCTVYLLYCVLCICYTVSFDVFPLDAGLLARGQYSEGPATGHLDTGFSWFPCVFKQMLRWFPTLQVATTRFSCSPPDVNLVANLSQIFC
jgi:hypothetical protein